MRHNVVLALVVIALAACSGEPTPEPIPTVTPFPASTPVPTSTPGPSPSPECAGPELDAFLQDLGELVEEWDDTQARGSNTARIALSPVIGELQKVKRKVGNLDAPWCAVEAQTLLVDYMEQVIKAFNLFMSGDWTDGQISMQFSIADRKLEAATQALEDLRILAGSN